MTNPHRLPTDVLPTRYDLTLRPDIDDASFGGHVTIDATAASETTEIVLNAIELEIGTVTVVQKGWAQAPAVSLDEETERLTLSLTDPLEPGDLMIDVSFDGILNDKLRGFYRSTFADDDGTEHTIATTQFESTNARRCFPCWDEPAHKAVFEVSLEVPDHMLAVSAMSEVTRTPLRDGLVRIDYAPTPLMSTYLLAFVVGELEASPARRVDDVPVRIIHRPGRGRDIQFAHDAAVFCLEWLTEYFGVPYFGDKIDLLAIPDFAFGAMENTGCVTFREVLLLVDPEATTQPEQQRSVAVIAHELAHMWFGNLVTMQWWEGLWLKEAFATFMETSATHAYRPDWKVWEGFALDRSAAYDVDSLHSTRSIEYEVESPADAEGMYDVLTYEKGASVVRMLEQYVGPDDFREGIRNYMRTHAFGNTVTSDLWNAIESATSLPVDEVMQEWIYEPGFPLVEASMDGDQVLLDQRRFVLSVDDGAADTEWKIPVTVEAGDETTTVLMSPHGAVPLSDVTSTVIVDPDSNGFFRTRYDGALAARLAGQLMDLSAGQRYRLFDDLFDLVLAGEATVGDFVQLCRALEDETAPPVWSAVTSGFATLGQVAPTDPERDRIGAIFAEVAGPQLTALGFDVADADEDQLVNEVRATLFSALGSLSRDIPVINHARTLFSGESTTDNASVESAAVRVIGSTGNRADFDECYRRFTAAPSPQIERRYLFSLARFDDTDAIDELCARTLDGSVRSQDAAFLLGQALGNRGRGQQVWSFITENWDAINATVPDNTVGRMLGGVQWLTAGDPAEVHAFLDAHAVPQAKLAVAQHRERLDAHVALRNRFSAELDAI
ncbi:MAG: M1 family metallopeptidase [Actinomycetota bacterium]